MVVLFMFSLCLTLKYFFLKMDILLSVVQTTNGKYVPVCNAVLKGLGHAILGNFSTDQMVIELTKIRK